MTNSSSNFDYFEELSSPQNMNPYLSAVVIPTPGSPADNDLFANLSPDTAHSQQQWISHQQQQRPSSPRPVNIASPFISPVDVSPLLSPASFCSDHFPGSGGSSPEDAHAWRNSVDALLAMNTPVTVPSTTPPLLGSSYSSTSSALLSMDTPPTNADINPLIEASPFINPSPIEQEDQMSAFHPGRSDSPYTARTASISPTLSYVEDNSVESLFHRFNLLENQLDSGSRSRSESALPNFDFDPIPMSTGQNHLGLPMLHIPRRSSFPNMSELVSPEITVTPAAADDLHFAGPNSALTPPLPGNTAFFDADPQPRAIANSNRPYQRHQRSHSANSLQAILGSNVPVPVATTSSGSSSGSRVRNQRQVVRRSASNSSRPFVCRHCDFAFTREWNRKTHERLHDRSFVPEHECTYCDKRFMRKHDCLRHMNSVHKAQMTTS
ncbi:hypothetical protein INT43_002860 [Umbelopsis isabellina]|uniref:C2H2-type domain-containing protein n=1 Tax=Mortierella isabellina TaxID=91625 RepID=A0A8H7Q5N0_MORIS|nr:hypothetical protein INT43_002860 [Umbelopsis isabellina]